MKILPDSSATVVLTQYHIKTSYQHKFLEVLGEYVLSALKATGIIMAEAYYEKGDPCIMWIIERWDKRALYKNNRRSNAAKAVSALTKIGLASPVETIFLTDLELLAKETSKDTSNANDQLLTIMLFVDVRAGTENHFKAINQAVIPAFRDEPGLLIFQLSQVSCHKTRFVICKKFRNRDALHYHLKDPALEPIIKFLQTSVKEPPFEKGYHHLIQFAPL